MRQRSQQAFSIRGPVIYFRFCGPRGKMRILHRYFVLVTQLCLTLCDPMGCSPPGSSVYGILQARILEWVAVPSSRDLLTRELNPRCPFPHCRRILYHLSHQVLYISN